MNDATAKQLRLIEQIRDALAAAGIDWWLYGGWAVDFTLGEITRDHSDIELFVGIDDAEAVRAALVSAGFAAPAGTHPAEAQPFVKEGQETGAWFLVTEPDGRRHVPGRWSGWLFPAGSFDEPPACLGRLEAPVAGVECLLDLKLNFAQHSAGEPLREKDIADIARLRTLLAARSEDDW